VPVRKNTLAYYKKWAVTTIREALLKGTAQYGWPPCTNKLRSTPFFILKYYFFYKTSNLYWEVIGTDPSSSVSIPCHNKHSLTEWGTVKFLGIAWNIRLGKNSLLVKTLWLTTRWRKWRTHSQKFKFFPQLCHFLIFTN
jgi:hypothetical protein